MNHGEWNQFLNHTLELRRYIKKMLYPYLREKVSIGELVDDTLHYAYRHPEQWQNIPTGNRLYYLKKIARYMVLNAARYHNRKKQINLRTLDDTQESMADTFLMDPAQMRAAHGKEKSHALEKILARLKNPSFREAVVLIGVEGYSIREAAEKMNRSYDFAAKMFQRGLAACKAIARTRSFDGFRVSGETV